MDKMTRAKLLKSLREHNFIKQDTAIVFGVDESTIRRWCRKYEINTDNEKLADLKDRKVIVEPTKKSKSGSGREGLWVIIPDLHDKTVSWRYLDALCTFISDFKPKRIVQLGDLMGYEFLLGVGKKKYPAFDGEDIKVLQEERQVCTKIISQINQAAPEDAKKDFLLGNHEYRAVEILNKFPQFAELLQIDKILDLSGWEIHDYLDDTYRIGKLHVIHGEYYGEHHVRKHLNSYQKNVIYGHTHRVQVDTMESRMRDIPIWGASIGCGCDRSPNWKRQGTNKWQHAFAYGWVDEKTGDFDPKVQRVVNHQFWAEGRLYKG